jgi:hypothetical protein
MTLLALTPSSDALLGQGSAVLKYALPSDAGGEVAKLAIQIHEEVFLAARFREAYKQLVIALAKESAEIWVVTGAGRVADVENLLAEAGLAASRFHLVSVPDPEFKASHVWARDALISASKVNGPRVYLRPTVSASGNFAQWLSSSTAVPLEFLNMALDGGDSLVIDDNFWLVGAGAVDLTIRTATGTITWAQAIDRIQTEIGRPAIIAGSPMPRGADVFWWALRAIKFAASPLMPAVNATTNPLLRAVRRASLAAWALKTVLVKLFRTGGLATYWLHLDLVASVTGKTCADGRPLLLVAEIVENGSPLSTSAKRVNKYLQGMSDLLEQQGVCVQRNPTVFMQSRIVSYNNTIVQRNPNVVWLPIYGAEKPELAAIDARNIKIWDDHGFKVITVPGWSAYHTAEGSIRCATLTLQRNP